MKTHLREHRLFSCQRLDMNIFPHIEQCIRIHCCYSLNACTPKGSTREPHYEQTIHSERQQLGINIKRQTDMTKGQWKHRNKQ